MTVGAVSSMLAASVAAAAMYWYTSYDYWSNSASSSLSSSSYYTVLSGTINSTVSSWHVRKYWCCSPQGFPLPLSDLAICVCSAQKNYGYLMRNVTVQSPSTCCGVNIFSGCCFVCDPCLHLCTNRPGQGEYLYSAFIQHLKALRRGSHSFTCKLHLACLSFISVHQMAPPLNVVANI